MRVELAHEVVDGLDGVHDLAIAGLVEENFDDVALCGSENDALHPLFALVLAHVRADDLDARAAEDDVERARVRDVRQIEADDFAALDRELVSGCTVDEHDVSESSHQRMGRRAVPPRERPEIIHQDVVEDERSFLVDRVVIVGLGRCDEHVPVEAEVLLDVLAHVRVVPVNSSIRKMDFVGEALAWFHRRLRHVGDPIEAVIEPEPMPMHRRRHLDLVDELDDDGRAPLRFDEWTWILAVIAIHQKRLVVDGAAHDACAHH